MHALSSEFPESALANSKLQANGTSLHKGLARQKAGSRQSASMDAPVDRIVSLDFQDTRLTLLCAAGLCLVVGIILSHWSGQRGNAPPFLNGSIFHNTYQYMTNMEGFLERVA